ncbi:MAG: DNA-directed RNA polymerase subunit alpha [Deltaproteobacteria bacterium GWB2_55_19]|nr:MAG: DNA-directed RNA polymerase subunit alpha [Deltaproteobacteria bacterium GWB2_55_19]HAO92901.1 DNA-directed RNA polymerase subunit alpha [Deltaproteobacteria bacterium]
MQKNWRDLIKPKKLEVEKETLTNTYGKFVAEPLERGFGVTIGNSIRRILLSSLQGAAITSVKIDGILHEFSSIPGVKEDVSDIILNLKQVRLKMHGDGPKVLRIKGSNEGVVRAGDIICDSTVEVLNPDQPIATVSRDAKFECEFMATPGKGYVPSERNKQPDQPIGVIPIDSIFQPVMRVNFNVTHARVGQRTDYDKLVLELWTTGAIDPQSAVSIAAKILKDQLSVFITFEESEDEAHGERSEAKPQFNENLFKTVDELELSVRSANCLKNADIKYIGEMVQKTEQEMLRTKNFGRKSLNEIKELLHSMGLDFGMKVDGFPLRKDLDAMHTDHKETA